MKEYILSKLPYAYDALEPIIDGGTVTLHHDKHDNARGGEEFQGSEVAASPIFRRSRSSALAL